VGRIFSINPIVLRHLADSSKNLITRCFKPEYFFYSFCGGNMYVYLMLSPTKEGQTACVVNL
jgi:hypothetical protein